MTDPTLIVLVTDLVRYAHLLAVAVGLGGAVMADLTIARNLGTPVTGGLTARLRELHLTVRTGLIAMWVTGLVLVAIRTGLDPAAVTPKLWSKLAVVSILSLNALVLGRVILPMLERNRGMRPVDLPWSEMLVGGWAAAVSTTSWLLALALGASALLKTGAASLFVVLLPAAYGLALAGATVMILALQLSGRNARAEADWVKRMPSPTR
ncbi:MAG: hypothetical protein AAFU80_14840 [Pseudomonadota bacterium]